jgi:hypothetical protein
MRHSIIIILLAASVLNSAGAGRHFTAYAQERTQNLKVIQHPEGVYHGAFPEFGETEDVVKTEPIKKFEDSVGKEIAWAYFSNNWFVENDEGTTWTEIKFPKVAVQTIWEYRKEHRIVPFIRMMPRSNWNSNAPDPVYTMQRIINGEFDTPLRVWATEARDTKIPLMVEFGAEVNGDWFSWSGLHNGGGETNKYGDPALPDGPERYRDAYRHIINLFRAQGVNNITWVFHVDAHASPKEGWNSMAGYYPGDDYIDWLGVSVYGPQEPSDPYQTFKDSFDSDNGYEELTKVSTTKPIAILEFGIIDHRKKPEWITAALGAIKKDYPQVKAISYWNSQHKNDDGSTSKFRLKGDSLKRYKQAVADPFFLAQVLLGQ